MTIIGIHSPFPDKEPGSLGFQCAGLGFRRALELPGSVRFVGFERQEGRCAGFREVGAPLGVHGGPYTVRMLVEVLRKLPSSKGLQSLDLRSSRDLITKESSGLRTVRTSHDARNPEPSNLKAADDVGDRPK